MTVPTETTVDTGAALPPGTSQDDLRLPDELRAALSPDLQKGLLPDAPSPDEDEDIPDDGDASDASADSSEDSQDSTEEDADAREEDPDAAQVGDFLTSILENPAAITRVPRALQPKVMDAFVGRVGEVVRDLVEQAKAAPKGEYERGYQAAKTELIVSEADQLFEGGDLDAFKAFVVKELGSVENYHRLKAGEPPKPTGANAEIQSEADSLYREFVTEFPNAEPAIRELWQRKRYAMTREGIRELTRDVERLRVRMEAGAGNDPASQELSRRKAAADSRAKLPRPPVANTGSRSAPVVTKAWLEAQDPESLAKRMEDEAFAKKVDEVLARG